MSPLITIGEQLRILTGWLLVGAKLTIQIAMAVVLVLLLFRLLADLLKLSPFGRLSYYVQRPTNRWFYQVRSSQFYYPLKTALKFDPVWLILLIGCAILFYLLYLLVEYVGICLNCISLTLIRFGEGQILYGTQALIGTVLLILIYFLMGLMTILVINTWFGLFDRAAAWAGQRIYPLLYSFDPSGKIGPLVFVLTFFLLSIAASAIQTAFF